MEAATLREMGLWGEVGDDGEPGSRTTVAARQLMWTSSSGAVKAGGGRKEARTQADRREARVGWLVGAVVWMATMERTVAWRAGMQRTTAVARRRMSRRQQQTHPRIHNAHDIDMSLPTYLPSQGHNEAPC